jgi:Holliday junction DNA helicase RuvB
MDSADKVWHDRVVANAARHGIAWPKATPQIETGKGPKVRRGASLFTDGPYPKDWSEYIGQSSALAQLRAAALSARSRNTRLGHVMLASGLHGIGKSSLARLIAFELGVAMTTISGAVTIDQARRALLALADRDVLFIDEFHQLARTSGWLLHLLQDGVLRTGNGEEQMPDVTVVAATTEAQSLPQTILSRFALSPMIEGYTPDEGLQIAQSMSDRLGLDPQPSQRDLSAMAQAADYVPRTIGVLLESYRDTQFTPGGNGRCDLGLALQWNRLTRDGLDRIAQAYLLALLGTGRASAQTVAGLISEPGSLRHTEKLLTSRGLITIEKDGRRLTGAGVTRARQLEGQR